MVYNSRKSVPPITAMEEVLIRYPLYQTSVSSVSGKET